MNLRKHYSTLYKESIYEIAKDHYEIDDLIDSKLDRRLGLTLVIRPSAEVKDRIQKFLSELKKVEPKQYYYPNSDIHITVMSIISCYDGFDIEKIKGVEYIELIEKCLPSNQDFKIQFKGLTASNSCIMLQGFPFGTLLNDIREKLRAEFTNSKVEQSLDKRYAIQTAHSTIVRFKEKFTQKDDFLKIIDNYAKSDFGTFTVEKMELVYNDWYQRKDLVQQLHEFKIGSTDS